MKILVGFDGSPYSKAALLYASRLAEKLGAELTVLIVVPLGAPAEDLVEEARSLAPHAEVVVDKMMGCFESPASRIAAYAERHGYDLIVVGAKGFTSREDALIGSNALWLAAYAPVNVLVVRLGSESRPDRSLHGPSEGSDP